MSELKFEHTRAGSVYFHATLGTGLHALVGSPAEVTALLEVASGKCRPKQGKVRLGELDVYSSPEARRHVATNLGPLPLFAPRVASLVKTVAQLRGESNTGEPSNAMLSLLDELDVGKDREVGSLNDAELARLGLALALGAANARAVLLDDPTSIQGVETDWLNAKLQTLAANRVVVLTARPSHQTAAPGLSLHGASFHAVGSHSFASLPVTTQPDAVVPRTLVIHAEPATPLAQELAGLGLVQRLDVVRDAAHDTLSAGAHAQQPNGSIPQPNGSDAGLIRARLFATPPGGAGAVCLHALQTAIEHQVTVHWLKLETVPGSAGSV